MTYIKSVFQALLAVTSLALALPGPAQAQAPRDQQEINSYVLTDSALARYTKAAKALDAVRKSSGGGCEDDDSDNPKSLDEMVAKFNTTPGVKAAIQGAGMQPREFLVFSMSIFQTGMASWGLSQPGGKLPPGVTMANVNFYRQHAAAIDALNQASGSDDCNGGDSEEEPEDGPSE